MNEQKQSTTQAAGALLDSALQLSASVAQVLAEAATGKPQEARPGDTHIQTIVRHGTTAATTIVTTVASAASAARSGTTQAPKQSTIPAIVAGTTLRVPLSVDNPSAEPMEGLTPALTELVCSGESSADDWSVTFEPSSLTVEPYDFEKLVVRVKPPETAPLGPASVTFSLGPDAAPVTLRFDVVTPA